MIKRIPENELLDYLGNCVFQKKWGWLFESIVLAKDHYTQGLNLEEQQLDLLAAGLIYAVGRHNGLHEKGLVNGIPAEVLAERFDLNVNDIVTRANEIASTLRLKERPDEYCDFDLSYVFEEFEEVEEDLYEDEEEYLGEFQDWVAADLLFQYKEKISKDQFRQFKTLIKKVRKLANRIIPEEESLELRRIKRKGKSLRIRIECPEPELEVFCLLLEEIGLKHLDTRFIELRSNLYAPTDWYDSLLQEFSISGLSEDDIPDDDEIIDTFDQFIGKTIDQNNADHPHSLESRATIDAMYYFALPKRKSVAGSKEILKIFPNCVEAYICLAGWQKKGKRRLHFLEKAMQAGEQILDIEFLDEQKLWWTDFRTRPYMRAMRCMAEEFLVQGEWDEGTDLLWELIEMDEHDFLRNRELLMGFCVLHKNWIEIREILQKFPDDQLLTTIYGKVIYLYYTQGRKSKTKKALFAAYRRNKYPIQLVCGYTPYPLDSDYLQGIDKVEALEVVDMLHICFERDEKFTRWILDCIFKSGLWDEDPNHGNFEDPTFPFLGNISDN